MLVLSAGSVFAQNKTANKPLTNEDIIQMSRAGVPEGTILTAIGSAKSNFDVSPQGIIALTGAGVGSGVMNSMIRAGANQTGDRTFGVATGSFPVKDAAGQTVHYSAWIRTENVQNGYAGLWWRTDGAEQGKVLSFDNSQARFIDGVPADQNGVVRGAAGTTGWTRYEFDLPVPAGARNINFGLLLTGTGTAWFDGLKIDVDGIPYVHPERFDLDFESPAARGFFTGGKGYNVTIDNTTAFSGKQSLKMQSVSSQE
jgi:hypothetical protein